MPGQYRWNETFTKTFIGFGREATTFTDAPMTDMDSPAALTNYMITDRTKQYWAYNTLPTVKTGTVVGSATPNTNFTYKPLGGTISFATALTAGQSAWISGSAIPFYFLDGGRNPTTTRQRQNIDLTSQGDAESSEQFGRPRTGGQIQIIGGPTFVNKAGKTVFLVDAIEDEIEAGSYFVLVFVNDTSNPVMPRQAVFANGGNTDTSRAMNQGVDLAFTYGAQPPAQNGGRSYQRLTAFA